MQAVGGEHIEPSGDDGNEPVCAELAQKGNEKNEIDRTQRDRRQTNEKEIVPGNDLPKAQKQEIARHVPRGVLGAVRLHRSRQIPPGLHDIVGFIEPCELPFGRHESGCHPHQHEYEKRRPRQPWQQFPERPLHAQTDLD